VIQTDIVQFSLYFKTHTTRALTHTHTMHTYI